MVPAQSDPYTFDVLSVVDVVEGLVPNQPSYTITYIICRGVITFLTYILEHAIELWFATIHMIPTLAHTNQFRVTE